MCPVTGLVLPDDPTDLVGLKKYRAVLYRSCKESESVRRMTWHACKDSFSFWANAFAWTPSGLKFRDDMKQVNQDLVMMMWRHWPVNDAMDAVYEHCRDEGRSLMVPKARDMRATLYFILRFTHNFLFRSNYYGLMLAHKEDLVDGKSIEGLMPRVRRVLEHLPPWMTRDRLGVKLWKSKHCVITNLRNGSMIAGAASTEEPATGERPSEVLFDEAAKNPNFSEAWDQTAAASKLRIAVSTYKGPERFAELDQEGVEVFGMAYHNHPMKGRGRKLRVNTNPFYPVKVGKRFVWSPWFERDVWDKAKQAPTQPTVSVAQNVLMDKNAGSSGFFDGDVIEALLTRARRTMPLRGALLRTMEPSPERDVAIIKRRTDLLRFQSGMGDTFRWWDRLPDGRPVQNLTYAIFADISQGRGESNSVAAIGCLEYGTVVGMYAVSEFEPGEFMRQLAELAMWVGGRGVCPLVGWEVNGPGEGGAQVFASLQFPYLWGHENEPGWRSAGAAKVEAANLLNLALQDQTLKVDDVDFYREAKDWAYLTATTVGAVKTHKDPQAKNTHGDRVVAVMGLNLMMRSLEKPVPEGRPGEHVVDMREWAKTVKRMGLTR